MSQRIYNSLELRARYVIGLESSVRHTAVELDRRSGRTTRSMYSAVTELLHGNNVDLYVEVGSASSHNMSFLKRLIEMSKVKVVSTKFSGFASHTIDINGERFTISLVPHTLFNINRYCGCKYSILLDHNIFLKYEYEND